MTINQCKFSHSLRFFEEGFKKRWELSSYSDTKKPCIFVGLYDKNDIDFINNHNGFKILYHPVTVRECIKYLKNENVATRICSEQLSDIFFNPTEWNKIYKSLNSKIVNFEFKDFSNYKPTTLGNKISCYIGNEDVKEQYGFSLAKEIEKKTKFKIEYIVQNGLLESDMIEIYKDCFINLKFCITGGYTTATEMAYMGRYSVSNSFGCFFKGYKTINDIVKIINKESEKIGTIQPLCIGSYFNVDSEWKNLNYWI